MQRKLFARVPPGVGALLGFIVFVCLALLAGYLVNLFPSAEDECRKQCAAKGQVGRMVPQLPPERTAGMRGQGAVICRCL